MAGRDEIIESLTRKTLKLLRYGCLKEAVHLEVKKALEQIKRSGGTYDIALDLILEASPLFNPEMEFTAEDAKKAADLVFKRTSKWEKAAHDLEHQGPVNSRFKEFALTSTPIANLEDSAEFLLYNEERDIASKTDRRAIYEVLGKDAAELYLRTKLLHAQFRYIPRTGRLSVDETTGLAVFNLYEPATWLRASLRTGEQLPPPPPVLPDPYVAFFEHLFDGHKESIEYVLDWTSTALTDRAITILTAIGDPGGGKGTLGDILRELVGHANYVRVRDEIFKGRFNSQLQNKMILHVDEVSLTKREEINKVKDLANHTIEVERKGKDAAEVPNHASVYLTSNHRDAIRIEPGDRRFSIVQLTDVNIATKSEWPALRPQLVEPENIAKLASFLTHRTVTRNMVLPFRSERFDEVLEESLTDWEYYFVFSWAPKNPGKIVSLEQAQLALSIPFPNMRRPGRRRFESLAKLYPDRLCIKREGSERYIESLCKPQAVVPFLGKHSGLVLPSVVGGGSNESAKS